MSGSHQNHSVFSRLRRDSDESEYTEGARVGDVIGDFRLLSRIASGGQGEVWEAEQVSLSRRVALKLVLQDRINEKTLALFAREARAGGRLAHPGIVTVFDYGEDDGRHWISQELVQGGWTLRDFIEEARNEEQLPEGYYRAVATFVAELADALQAAHAEGVIHRDVKPPNVLVTEDEHPKLSDFGLARLTDELGLSVTGDFAGTWLYMSPEQVTAKRIEIDHRTDIFSLGVVMYEMLALTRPFDGDTTHQIAEKIMYVDPPDLHKIRSRVPRDLAVICAKALEKRKQNRYAMAGDLASDIRRHLANEPIHARPPTSFERAYKWMQRNPAKSVAMVGVTLAFTVISSLGLGLMESNEALAESNSALETSNVALGAKTQEAEQSAEEAKVNARRAQANATRADAEAQEAKLKTADVLRLSLGQDFEDLMLDAASLWPVAPEKIGRLRAWISEAGELVGELPLLIAKRADLRALAVPLTEAEALAERESHPDFEQLAALRAAYEAKVESAVASAVSDDEIAAAQAELSELRLELRSLEARVNERRTWVFAEEDEDGLRTRWWHNQVTGLIGELESLTAPGVGLLTDEGVSEAHGWSVAHRLGLAERLESGFASGGEFSHRWAETLPAIDAAYPGLDLSPQMGLVPIGANLDSGLWEFWDVQTGTEPLRGEDGVLELEESSGLVFVLLRGGQFWMGAQASDPTGQNYDPDADSNESPVHEVRLSAFFLSKYEMTQGQWKRLTGWNRSQYGADGQWSSNWARDGLGGDLLQPVTNVSWSEGFAVMDRWGLTLPSEAQWEYGCRAGTSGVYWSGDAVESLQDSANLADKYATDNGAPSNWNFEEWLDDGYVVHARVNTLLANGFGLHHVHGNVWEWCLDGYVGYSNQALVLNPLSDPMRSATRVYRGGSFNDTAVYARSANRINRAPSYAVGNLGLRAARVITK